MYLPARGRYAAHQCAAIPLGGDRHDACSGGAGQVLGTVAAAVVGHDDFPANRIGAECAQGFLDAANHRFGFIETGHDDRHFHGVGSLGTRGFPRSNGLLIHVYFLIGRAAARALALGSGARRRRTRRMIRCEIAGRRSRQS